MSRTLRQRFRYLRLRTVVLLTIVPALLLATLQFRSFAEFYYTKLRLRDQVVRTVKSKNDVTEFYYGIKKESFFRLFTFNTHAENIVAQQRWANDEIHIDIRKKKFEELTENLPKSGEDYKKMTLWQDSRFYNARMRLRGNSDYHWSYPRKSLKIKTTKKRLFRGHRRLNLTVKNLYSGIFMNEVARNFGLLTPRNARVKTFLNNQFYSLHRFMEEIDEGFLRRHGRMPGNIYKGESVAATNEYHFGTRARYLYYTPYVWPKIAVDNSLPEKNRSDLLHLTKTTSLPEREKLQELKRIWKEDAVLNHLAFKYLFTEYHSTDSNNIKLYLDPIDGKFEPIIWDPQGYDKVLAFDLEPSHPSGIIIPHPYYDLGADPRFLWRAMQRLYQKLSNEDFFKELHTEMIRIIHEDEDASQVEAAHPVFSNSKKSFRSRHKRIERNRKTILGKLESAESTYAFQKNILVVGTKSHAGVYLTSITVASASKKLSLFADRDRSLSKSGSDTTLWHQVTALKDGSVKLTLDEPLLILPAYTGNNRLNTKVLPHPIIFSSKVSIVGIETVNGITKKKAPASAASAMDDSAVDSYHPWDFPTVTEKQTITLDYPIHTITEDWIIPEHQTIKIRPGTSIVFEKGVSIVSYGKIIAEGTEEKPIVFEPLAAGFSWGVLALQGNGASGSRFAHVHFRGGSRHRYRSVRYPGMLTVHYADDVSVRHCTFSENLVGDDAFRAAYSTVNLENNFFYNTNSDAIDFDHSGGRISGNSFLNVGNDCIDLMTSAPRIENNDIETCGDKGISIGENSAPIIFNNKIYSSEIGIQVKDSSDPLILHNDIRQCKTGLYLYEKNWRYGKGGTGRVYNTTFSDNESDLQVKDSSTLFLYSSIFIAPDSLREKGKLVEYIREGVESGKTHSRMLPNTDIYKEFAAPTFKAKIGYLGRDAVLESRSVIFEQIFLGGLGMVTDGWQLDGGVKLYVEDNLLKAELKEKNASLSRKFSFQNLPALSRLDLRISSSEQTTATISLAGSSPKEFSIAVGEKLDVFYLDLPAGSLEEITIRTEKPVRLRLSRVRISQQLQQASTTEAQSNE